jgi:hypothetical protein
VDDVSVVLGGVSQGQGRMAMLSLLDI